MTAGSMCVVYKAQDSCTDVLCFVTAKVLLTGRVILQVFSGPKVAGVVVEQILGQHTEFVKSSDRKCICLLALL